MPVYKGVLTTEDRLWAGSFDHISIKVVGTDGESQRITLPYFLSYPDSDFEIEVDRSIGKLVLIELKKSSGILMPQDSWYPAKVELKSPEGKTFYFPIHRWITDDEVHQFREATACLVVDDTDPLAIHSRTKELKLRKEQYCWNIYAADLPQCMEIDSVHTLPDEVRFSFTKAVEFGFTALQGLIELKLDGLADCKEQWTSIDAIGKVFRHKQTALSEYVQQNWMKDSLFGYQFLNGVNPMVIRRCSVLPENFPVTDQMVFLRSGKSLAEEMQNGNIFLCDYKLLDGLKANEVNGKQQYLMAPLVLLHKTQKKLLPIAIQLKQEPSKDNPIFCPADSVYDWLLAKMFVRSADFQVHQLNSHLLRTHLLAEVFSVSILRNLPMVHPLYKLLVPNTRYTLQINFLARELLISDGGFFNKFTASGGEAMQMILQRANSSITYTSLCVRDDIKERGLESVPHFYYRDDAFQIWDIINRFVQGVLGYYYKDDSDVQRDTELQTWVLEIFEHGFLSRPESGIPQRLNTVAELVKFVTMVIFTCSAQHGAVNNGQFDYGSWMPNTPATLQRPPPTTKGTADESSLLETLPDVNATVHGMSIMYLLSKPSSDFVPFGHYPEEYFSEVVPRQQMHLFKGELGLLNSKIEARNLGLKIPYTFLDPVLLENSVAI
ncbi:polyunsaturated fatty acid lipoxygenase ALOX15B-like [Gadus chalcogrammus]|uniref:polyunsaturated fatty acid lipoxygenase ALOX15B-like n=1 Tax=Gadus chalcogrammus TaxID=1042646 RepID=UPI0024C4B6B2|nr:polyunsaturated fatty acid lipoxygenase ALOX15B-like [Gadus chalcogrammus]XP_056439845.1 polyunsaturated fatty acid lipoxygenase ALOX15B-like [Gadus chalcogrammus]